VSGVTGFDGNEDLESASQQSNFNLAISFTSMRHSANTICLRTMMVRLALALFLAASQTVFPQAPSTNRPWAYLLLNESYLLDDCPVCARVPIKVPMRGTFNLRALEQNTLFSRYALEDIKFTAGDRPYRVTGSGTFEIGGEVALILKMFLQVEIDDGITNKVCYFTNAPAVVDRPWPMINMTLDQTNGTFAQVFTLRLAAAPVREIWFSTVNFFKAITGPAASNIVEGGDLISTSGNVVKRNADLFTSVGAYPPAPDLGLDAVEMLPGGEIAFSLGSDITSNTLGPLQHGDLLSTKGRILRRNQELLASFGIQPLVPDVGLDAVRVLDTNEVFFSISTNIFSERLNAVLHRGDLLSSTGSVWRSNQQLLSRFHPTNAVKDFGLDAFHLWPGGEIWFSTEDGFQDQVLGPISGGDLLSDQGYIVFLNSDLLSAFTPTNAPSEIGLDALYVITDDIPPAPAPRLDVAANPATGSVGLAWQGQGRVFQVERADDLNGLFRSLSPILPDLSFEDAGTLTNRIQSSFYRLHQW